MSNTVIQLKFSNATDTPPALNIGEPAYSFTSDKLFIGNSTNHVLTIGGKYYVDLLEASTSANTGNTLVLRDATGNASFNYITANFITGTVEGNADTASALQTARDIGLDGDATGNVSFDGSSDVTLTVELTNTGVVANTYGGATQIPTFVVDEDGRITSAANVSISTTLSVAGDSGTDSIALASDTLTFTGADGITTSVDAGNNTVNFDVDNTVVRTSGSQTINGDVAITGNLIITGNTITQDVQNITTEDSLIELAANNISDALDIGFFGQYNDGTTKYTTLIRDASDSGIYKLLTAGSEKPSAGNTVNTAAFTRATLDANFTGGTVSGLSSVISIADGGTNANSFSSGLITYFDGTKLNSLANTGTAGTYANASHVPVITTDDYGRVSGVTNTAIAIDTSQVTSGTLPIARGGTNQTSYTSGALLINDGTSIASLANTTYVQTGTLTTSNTVSSITVDAYGRLTALTSSLIAIDAGQITSGILGVARGGTGANTFTTNGVMLGQGTSALTTVSSSTEGHILTINSSGVPQFQMLSGGTF
jgi:hypothetical protein